MRTKLTSSLVLFLAALSASGCELCAIYNANNAASSGFFLSVASQYIPYETTQFKGQEVAAPNRDYVDSSITHLVPSYNFSPSFGVSLNVPVTFLNFERTDLKYSPAGPPVLVTEKGSEAGLGDIALIGRVTVYQHTTMQYGLVVNLLGGVKFPSGDSARVKEEAAQAAIFESLAPPGASHDPLEHSVSSVHEHDLAFGSGSYDGIFGLTLNARWRRWFGNGQLQYYLRTEGEAGFKFGNELIVSGGPGAFVLLTKSCTLSLQANAVYDALARDELLNRPSDSTGMTGWYLGPLINFTWGEHFSANLGIDAPLRLANNGLQVVPDYALHGGFSWRF